MAHKDEKDVVTSLDHDMERHIDEKHGARRRSTIADVLHGGDNNAIEGQIFSMNSIDPALDAKMRLVNHVSVATLLPDIFLIATTGNQSDRLDKLPRETLLLDRFWLHGRQFDPGHSICDS